MNVVCAVGWDALDTVLLHHLRETNLQKCICTVFCSFRIPAFSEGNDTVQIIKKKLVHTTLEKQVHTYVNLFMIIIMGIFI